MIEETQFDKILWKEFVNTIDNIEDNQKIKETFTDYTKWQRSLWKDDTIENLSKKAMRKRKSYKKHKNQ